MTPSWRVARIHEPFSPQLRRNGQRSIALARAELETVFAQELVTLTPKRRARLVNALLGVTLWAMWESLRTDVGLDIGPARQVVLRCVSSLLAASGFDSDPT